MAVQWLEKAEGETKVCCSTGYRTQGSWVRYPVWQHTFVSPSAFSRRSWVRYPVWQHTFVSPSAFSRRAVVSYWRKYVHEVLVNRLGGLSLSRKSAGRLTDRPDMTLDVYRGRKTTMQQQQSNSNMVMTAKISPPLETVF